jgi:hypothetical protein
MKILVDADACPVKTIIEKKARESGVELIMVCNPNHAIESSYAQVIMVDYAPEAVDIAITNRTQGGDIVVTQDYGLASLVLAKKAQAIHPDGRIYNSVNIETLLAQRYLNARARRGGMRISGPAKRNSALDQLFEKNFEKLLQTGSDAKGD